MQHASAVAVSIPLEGAVFLRNRGDEPATLEDIAVGINRSEEEVEKHLPEMRKHLRRMLRSRA